MTYRSAEKILLFAIFKMIDLFFLFGSSGGCCGRDNMHIAPSPKHCYIHKRLIPFGEIEIKKNFYMRSGNIIWFDIMSLQQRCPNYDLELMLSGPPLQTSWLWTRAFFFPIAVFHAVTINYSLSKYQILFNYILTHIGWPDTVSGLPPCLGL